MNPEDSGSPADYRVITVTMHLPVVLSRDPASGRWTARWDDFAGFGVFGGCLDGMFKETLFVGCLYDYVPEHERPAVARALLQLNCFPVFVEKDIMALHMEGFCKAVLWPAFHNVVDLYSSSDASRVAADKVSTSSPHPLATAGLTRPAPPLRRTAGRRSVPHGRVSAAGAAAAALHDRHERHAAASCRERWQWRW